ncbi:hypothetical protein [Halobacillus sp. B29]|uniref:hypothetical protein n=1 Tax=Halobacillus sp. B29 TaxID=3457432 RepID=UPI003FCCE1A3
MIVAILILSALFFIMFKVPKWSSKKQFEKNIHVQVLLALVTAGCISIIVFFLDPVSVEIRFTLAGMGIISVLANLKAAISIYIHQKKVS